LATLKEVAKAAGVSTAVVSRLLSGDKTLRVGAATRERILRIVEALDYTPNIAAQSLRLARSRLIALIVHNVSNPVYAEIVSGAEAAAAARDSALLLGEAASLETGSNRLIDLIGAGAIDGLVLQGAGAATDRALAKAVRKSVRTVMLQVETDADSALISLPDQDAAAIATDHLLALGHERIGCLATAPGLRFSLARVAGWRSEMARHGLEAPDSRLVWAGSDLALGRGGVKRLIDQAPEITGIVVCNAVAAIGALAGLGDLEIDVPGKVSVIALHDFPLADYVAPALTTVRMPLAEMGAAAVNLICGDADLAKHHVTIDRPAPRIILRRSTARARG